MVNMKPLRHKNEDKKEIVDAQLKSMDGYSGKRAVSGLDVPRKGSRLVLRDTSDNKDQKTQSCNRIGCSGRLQKSTQTGTSEKPKSFGSTFRSSSGKEVSGSSSRVCTVNHGRKKEDSSSENSTIQGESEGSSRAGSSSMKIFRQKVTYPGKNNLTKNNPSSSLYGLRNLKCNSVLDVAPQPSESNTIKKRDMLKRTNPQGDGSSSSFRGKKVSGISISDSPGRVGYRPNPNREVRIGRSMDVNTRVGRVNGNKSPPPPRPRGVKPQPIQKNVSGEGSSSESSCYSGGSDESSDGLSSLMPLGSSAGLGVSRLANLDGLHRHNMEGIAEVLLALERIEQDEVLTYEQLLALESNLFLGSLNFLDQHRDMRLDIDNMSYEELLALEEKMGSVSTAVSEEAIGNCVKRSIYQQPILDTGNLDYIKCSICQEEYVDGDEMGSLECEHGYHALCVQDWLRVKNWCPVCKAPALPSTSQSS